MDQNRRHRPKQGKPCDRCGIRTTARPTRSVLLCMECKRDSWYVEKVGA